MPSFAHAFRTGASGALAVLCMAFLSLAAHAQSTNTRVFFSFSAYTFLGIAMPEGQAIECTGTPTCTSEYVFSPFRPMPLAPIP